MTATETAVQLARLAGRAASDKLATDIVLIDVSDRLAITDIFVIVTGGNERQVEAIVDEVEDQLRLAGSKPLRREGKRDGRWVLLDYSEIVVHVQHAEERVFYSLERLWKDCPVIDFHDNLPEGSRPAAEDGLAGDEAELAAPSGGEVAGHEAAVADPVDAAGSDDVQARTVEDEA